MLSQVILSYPELSWVKGYRRWLDLIFILKVYKIIKTDQAFSTYEWHKSPKNQYEIKLGIELWKQTTTWLLKNLQ